MLLYKRNYERKLISLRISFIALTSISVYFYTNKISGLVYLSALALVLLSFYVIKNFSEYEDSFEITKFYFFGLFTKKWRFDKMDNIRLKLPTQNFGDEFEAPSFDDASHTGLGCLPFTFFMFFPPRITHMKFLIQSFDDVGKTLKQVSIFLDRNEYNIMQNIISRNRDLS